MKMNTTMLSSYPKHLTTIPLPLSSKSQQPRHFPTLLRFPTKSSSSDSNNNTTSINDNDNESQPITPSITPPNTVEVRYRRRSSKRRKQREEAMMMDEGKQGVKAKPPPKDWESMTLSEKAIELYMGEKGALFWLNKFAYASIYIIIGGWILFRFVGPALDLYQLDTPPLAPQSLFTGSEKS